MASFAERRAASLARPPIDLRALLQGEIRDQGPRPLCLPISVSGAHEVTRARLAATSPQPLAPEPLWAHCVQSAQVTPQGTTLAAVGNALADQGQPTLRAWPYNPALGTDTERLPLAQRVTARLAQGASDRSPARPRRYRESSWRRPWPTRRLSSWSSRSPREFENADSSGEISVPPLNSPEGDYHAVLAVGAASDAATAAPTPVDQQHLGRRLGRSWLRLATPRLHDRLRSPSRRCRSYELRGL